MYLKAIEMVGFKSFADKTRIELDKGFTAIIGPNGSGKSNIIEAIKWVLGEQSAKSLRGKRMDDVVFAGSSQRRQSQYAQVSLIFDNKNHILMPEVDQVSISRRYTRNGESLYQINEKACRLKDITQLMMDTGVGKESFSIISQGKVEEIFSQKPEERRAIFEEAAGVMKYKSRKQEAERKLLKAHENLNRIKDIVHEIEGRLEPLRLQKEAAESYQIKKKELSEIEIALTAVQIETLNEKWQLTKKDLEAYQKEHEEKRQAFEHLQEQLADDQVQLDQSEMKVNQLNAAYVQVVQKAEKASSRIQIANQKKEYQFLNQQSQQQTLEQLKTRLDQQKDEANALQAKERKQQEEVEAKQALYDRMKESLQQIKQEEGIDLESLRNDYISLLQRESDLKNQIQQIQKDLDQYEQQNLRFQKRKEEQEAQKKAFADQVNAHQKAWQEASDHVRSLVKTYQEKAQAFTEKKKQVEKLKAGYQQTTTALLQKKAQKDSLQALADHHDGFYFGVKNALAMKAQFSGMHGAVAQLLEVPEEYALACEVVLGGAMQNIVTDSGASAQAIIKRLREKKAGRATFLPLDTIKSRSIPRDQKLQLVKEHGFLGVLVDLVSYQSLYKTIMENLMGQILVAQDLTYARQIAKKIHYRYRVVTLAGDVVNAGGSLTGGATKQKQGGLLSRKNQLRQLQASIDQLTQSLHEEEDQLEAATSHLKALQEELLTLQKEGDESRFEERRLKEKEESLNERLQEVIKELQAGEYDETVLSQDREDSQQDLQAKQDSLEDLTHHLTTLKQQMDHQRMSEEEKSLQEAQIQKDYQEISTTLAVLKEQLKQTRIAYCEKDQQLASSQEEITHLENYLEELESHSGEEESSLSQLETTYQALLDEKKQLEKQLHTAKSERRVMQNQQAEHDEAYKELNQGLQSLLQKLAKLEASAGRYEVAIDNHLEQLREEYGLTYERAREVSDLKISVEEASNRVRLLKRQIDQLGPVNLASIEEYEEVHTRYEFMIKQRDDILEAMNNLYQTIEEMDTEVSERFKETFGAIQQAFERIFPALFGGGKASLRLTDEGDLLHTGIEIMAQPPGKRLQLLSLLSGGERALTAIALLFAILDVKTVPFSILDEVEAALDDNNVARYGKYLQDFSEKTQFIVISHRKGTMQSANILYGVTMQERGVSKLASVRLEDVAYLTD